ncbi:MAG TPA: PIN domain-containing protein [Verrucomicrobiales bacterium]|nr:PIN domain-containing protein [Verrucomicrobiales bacterium]
MKQFFDTSVLISAFVEDEICHEACARVVAAASSGMVYAHALAECFSILTGGRLSVQLPAADATRILEANVFDRMTVISLTPREVMWLLGDCHRLGVRGGGVYDCLHIAAARKGKADELLTLNVRHFAAFAPDLASRIRKP